MYWDFVILKNTGWQSLKSSLCNFCTEWGASSSVFVDGHVQPGWEKTVYDNEKESMYTYDPAVMKMDDGSKALCANIFRYGGFDFHSHKKDIKTLSKAKSVEFWSKFDESNDNLTFMVNNLMRVGLHWCPLESPQCACWAAFSNVTRSALLYTSKICLHFHSVGRMLAKKNIEQAAASC